jgi:hypothetical protein
MFSAYTIFIKYNIDLLNLKPLYDEFDGCIKQAELAMAAENRNAKIGEKNKIDNYRDKLHSKLFKQLQSILCDERDTRFDDAQAVMQVVKEVGNPTKLAENAESTVIKTLGNKLSLYAMQLESTGTASILQALLNANDKFIELETECRKIDSDHTLNKVPSMRVVRKKTDAVYRLIKGAINGYANIPSKMEEYRKLVNEMNVLVAKYDTLLATRRKKKS